MLRKEFGAKGIDLYYQWYLKILSKLHAPSGECNLKEFLNHDVFEEKTNVPLLICKYEALKWK